MLPVFHDRLSPLAKAVYDAARLEYVAVLLSAFVNGSAIRGAYCFSHPKDFTPVCTTKLGHTARISPNSTSATPRLSGSA
jgi:alkyl hydroperoxide reductase subunit AhpC